MFHIEKDFYLMVDECSFNIVQKSKTESGQIRNTTVSYHRTPEQAIESYLALAQRTALSETNEGTLKDMVDILVAENKRLQNTLKSLFSQVCDIELRRPTDEE